LAGTFCISWNRHRCQGPVRIGCCHTSNHPAAAEAAQRVLRAIERIEHGNCECQPLSTEGATYFGFPTRAAYREFRQRGRRLW
jgi:hypothetical protein